MFGYTGEKLLMREKENWNKFEAAFRTICRILVSFFKVASRKFVFIFLFNNAGLKFKTISACTESTDVIIFV